MSGPRVPHQLTNSEVYRAVMRQQAQRQPERPAERPPCEPDRCSPQCMTARVCLRHHIKACVDALVRSAAQAGLVVTVEQVPLQPLAMGNYKSVVSVRPARAKS